MATASWWKRSRDQINTELNWARLVQRTLRPRIIITDQEINDEAQRIRATRDRPNTSSIRSSWRSMRRTRNSAIRDSAERLIEQLNGGPISNCWPANSRQDEGALKGGDWGWMRRGPDGARRRQADPGGAGRQPGRTGARHRRLLHRLGASETRVVQLRRHRRRHRQCEDVRCGRCRRTRRKAKSTARSRRPRPSPAGSRVATRCPRSPSEADARRLSRARQRAGRRLAGPGAEPRDQPAGRRAGRPVRTSQGVALYMICARQAGDESGQSRTSIADRLGQQRLETAGARLSQRPAARGGDRHPHMNAP